VTSTLSDDVLQCTYIVERKIFFASTQNLAAAFDFKEALDRVIVDVRGAHIWDLSGVAALDRAVLKFWRKGADVEVIGMNEASATLVDQLGVYDNQA